jgi:hypothetical protein
MAALQSDLRSFNESGYEIHDQELDVRRELTIWSVDPLVPKLGDLFTVQSRGVVYEVTVVQLITFKGGWSALCRVTDVF